MEQDLHGFEGDLPTYNELAAQSSPNSRFGRWKGWVEKRAAERYAEETPERRLARRSRGWGPHVDTQTLGPPPPLPQELTPSDIGLNRTQTVLSTPSDPDADADQELPSIALGQALTPSHLKLYSFGSRFLPHSEQPILSCLPLFEHQKLLLGHADGLSLLDMTPERKPSDSDSGGPRRRDIWHGEGVYQMAILEHEQTSSSTTPMGVVLALVGAEPPENASDKESTEPHKAIRMYNLSSLASLVRWAASRKDHTPVELARPVNWQPQQKKHKSHLSVSRVFMSPTSSSQSSSVPPPPPPKDWPRPPTIRAAPDRADSTDSWDVFGDDDVPLQWATDYVPLASASSRLANHSVLLFELHKSADEGRVTARLAVATKQFILLYETVRGERAFRFVKEFYTPVPARSVTFVSQVDAAPKTLSPGGTTRSTSMGQHTLSDVRARRISSPVFLMATQRAAAPAQLSLFVVFEKKAGLIRIADSAVGELELWADDPPAAAAARSTPHASPKSAGSFRRSLYAPAPAPPPAAAWAPPAELALPPAPGLPPRVCLLTRGRATHVVRAPLAMPLAAAPPLAVLAWGARPARVVPRVCAAGAGAGAVLQVTALGGGGVEVQELALAALLGGGGKGKARAGTVAVQADVGPGGAGFLCGGGHWAAAAALRRRASARSLDTAVGAAGARGEAGFYAWTQYALRDWRVFWLGGDDDDGGGGGDDDAPP